MAIGLNLRLDSKLIWATAAVGFGLWLFYTRYGFSWSAANVKNQYEDLKKIWFGTPEPERIWEVPYRERSTGYDPVWFKPYDWPSLHERFFPPTTDIDLDKFQRLSIVCNNRDPKTFLDCAKSGHWTHPNDGFRMAYCGTDQLSTRGDPRALWSLAVLLRTAGLTGLNHLGMYPGRTTTSTHAAGYAIDVIGGYAGELVLNRWDTMNALVSAAQQLNCPLAWISTDVDRLSRTWPLFQLRKGIKTRVSSSRQDHSSHFHLYLPRPDIAMNYVISS